MSSKALESSIKKLTDKGFSKSKAQKALKDCNNNVQQALKLLENQALQAEKAAKAEELLKKKELERACKEAQREARRAQGLPEDSDEERAMENAQKQKIKLHPCVVQYGSCKFGKFCHFKHLPGDTCVNYLLGNCIYDIKCRNRHSYEGEDLRKFVKEMKNEALVFEDQRGSYYGVDPNAQGKVVVSEYYGASSDPSQALAAPAPLPSAFDVGDGAEATYTEPAGTDTMWIDDLVDHKPAPQPFLERLKTGLETKIAEKSTLKKNAAEWTPPKVTVIGGNSRANTSSASAKERFSPFSGGKHPCLYQMGSCKFGDLCAHINQPADVCVFFLNGKCRLSSEECEYRHERVDDPEHDTLLNVRVNDASSRMCALLPSASLELRIDPIHDILNPVGIAVTLPHTSCVLQIENETEETSFYFLKEAFPDADNLDILQAIRLGGTREAACDLLIEFNNSEYRGAADIERLLQEQEATEELIQEEGTERLITLCQLFPNLEVDAIEAVLLAYEDFDSTFRILQSQASNRASHESSSKKEWISKKEANSWRQDSNSFNAADKLKLDRLYSMFRDLPKEVIEEVYKEVGGMPKTVDTLRVLTHELNDITEEDRVEADKLRTYHFSPTQGKSSQSFKVSRGDASSFSVSAGQSQSETHFISDSDLYKQVVASVDGKGDWRRLRHEANMINRARIQCVSLAGQAYMTGKGKVAHDLGSRARQLGILYEKTNILAMHALEAERKGCGINILDLHGFRKDEAIDVLKRRMELCIRQRVRRLRVVLGKGVHSNQGRAVLFPFILDHLSVEPFCSLGIVTEIKEAYVDVDLNF